MNVVCFLKILYYSHGDQYNMTFFFFYLLIFLISIRVDKVESTNKFLKSEGGDIMVTSLMRWYDMYQVKMHIKLKIIGLTKKCITWVM